MKRIAVLLTCFNRKMQTLKCLESLSNAIEVTNSSIRFDTYLVDDGSTDDTAVAVSINFPEITIINGSGNLFWARGMRLAWETALGKNLDYDSFLLLNDDVILSENFIKSLLNTHEYCLTHFRQSGIYACFTLDTSSREISYGGKLIVNKGIRIKSVRVKPGNIPVKCSMANANIMMVTKTVVTKIGILDPKFIHRFADFDLTLTANKFSIPVLMCPGIGGYCNNNFESDWLSAHSTLKQRIDYLYSPKGLSYRERLYYLNKHFKYQVPYYFIMLWLQTLFPIFWDNLKKRTYFN
jgi:GT2 family glycosyltransferase